ncbi:MAG: M23 family metallopeptidase [Sphaerochaeta sp.]|jgi:murein DD-endopeptidase MepM/ murein hydrolase activator NlpD|nr:M23 family metallopeptidase [Sphaerochaeta sp.]MCI2045415.1 M23 family metallopeptidase [Sphaerochaeta sp.]MCI2097065.1 M23 family metallopeptidase [Sphaerochaeta sp.]MCI2128879.1 M23 family metallopeptidase [Sphaerochaeta sp.]
MGRDSYDDMQERNDGNKTAWQPKGNNRVRVIAIVLSIGISALLLILWWNSLYPAEKNQSSGTTTAEQAVVTPVPPASPTVEVVSEAPVVQAPQQLVQPAAPAASAAQPASASTTAVSLSDTRKASASKNSVQYLDHVVADGEDLTSIAAQYGLKTQTIISVNQVRNVNAIKPGKTLRIPDRDGQLYEVKSGDMLSTIARTYHMGWKTLMEVNALTSEIIRPGQTLFIPDVTQPGSTDAEISTVSFQKPAQGSIVGAFGQPSVDPSDEGSLDGVLIQGSAGTAVYAAADGDVVDAGYEQKGRGRFVVISHADGYRTNYAHLENVDVKSGVKVAKGQVIGSMGSSGTEFIEPTLYFAIEQNGISLNPADFF